MSRQSEAVCLAVLPFEDLSVDGAASYFARGFVEDLIIELSRFPTLEIFSSRSARQVASLSAPDETAGELGVDYLLKGSFRHAEERIRITTQLVDAGRGTVLWAERYDSPVNAIFEIQDDITSQVAAALSVRIEESHLARARRKPVTELAAYDCWLRGMEHLRRGTLADDQEARKFFQQALEIEPQSARAFAGLSLSYFNEWSCQLWDRWEENEAKAFDHASRAFELDEADHIIQLILGRIHLFRREFDRAKLHIERAWELNPNDADNLVQVANCLAYLGAPDTALALMEKALRLNPYHDTWYYAYGAMPHFILRDYETALDMASRIDQNRMVDLPAFCGAAAAYLGRTGEGARHMEVFRRSFIEKITYGKQVSDDEMLEWVVKVNPYRDPEQSEHLAEGLRRAGLSGTPGAGRGEPAAGFQEDMGVRHMSFAGLEARLPEIKGFADIATLLSRPGEELHCADLYGAPVSDGDAVLDERAKREIRRRVAYLEEEIAEAQKLNDLSRISASREELELLLAQLESATGLGGRSRRLGSTSERARSAVTQRIRTALARICEAHPRLGAHLSQSIRTGTFCSYQPAERIRWDL